MNTVILSGNVSQKYDNGTNVRLSIADNYKDKTVFIPVTLYDNNAVFAREHIEKGDHISIEGRLGIYKTQDNREIVSIIAHRVSFEGYKNPHKGVSSYNYSPPSAEDFDITL